MKKNSLNIKYNYELNSITPEQAEQLKKSFDAADSCLLASWYWVTAPTEDYIQQAGYYYNSAADKGNIEAKFQLANMDRLGEFGPVDIDYYIKVRDEAASQGCDSAEIRLCRDIAYGVAQPADLEAGLEEALRRLESKSSPDPRWYDMIGWLLYRKGEVKKAEEYFLKAIEKGYLDSYSGLMAHNEAVEKGRAAGIGMCCLVLADQLEKQYDEVCRNDTNAVECFSDEHQKKAYLENNDREKKRIAKEIEELYKEAIADGEPYGYFYLGMIYYKSLLGQMQDEDKAWKYFMRGCELRCPNCMAMIADMIEDGYGPEEYQWKDVCLFRLNALRWGDDSQLLPVVQAYFEDELPEHEDEIKKCYIPMYEAQEFDPILPNFDEEDDDYEENDDEDWLENWPDDDDPEDDDGRFDAWA